MTATEPYLSVVVTSRNDDHGGGMLRRMQTFVHALTAQCARHRLRAELIVVEWNPPPDRPRLTDALAWPTPPNTCSVRIIEVPAALHDRLENADRLPLFQMIAKNVGIRRSRAPFVLATNIDVLLNDELTAFLASGSLQRGRMYRVDRTDVGPDVPVEAPLDEQLAYCRSHLLRVNAREGVFPLDADGSRGLAPNDICDAAAGCRFGAGWYGVEADASGRFRWSAARSTLAFPDGVPTPRRLFLDVEPGPAVGYAPFDLEVRQPGVGVVARARVGRRQIVTVEIAPDRTGALALHLLAQGSRCSPIPDEPRRLAIRVFGVSFVPPPAVGLEPPPGEEDPGQPADGAIGRLRSAVRRIKRWALTAKPEGGPTPTSSEVVSPVELHLGAPGDFTLMAREHWWAVQAHPEFPVCSLHLDTVLCYQAHLAGAVEEVLPEAMKLYHIEHGSGSGWTPEGHMAFLTRMAERGIPVLEHTQVMRWATEMTRAGKPIAFNDANWGLADCTLPETVIGTPRGLNAA